MRSEAEVERIRSLISLGYNDCAIARLTGMPRSTVKDWRHGKLPRSALPHRPPICFVCRGDIRSLPSREYAYLLGQYLGDGSIAQFKRGVFALRIFSFSGYRKIIDECCEAVVAVMPSSKVRPIPVPNVRLVVITSYSKHWPCLFPQHGPGRKHDRPISLSDWQQTIVEHHPEAFLRGLIHSDGCRYVNRVKHYEYPSYGFTNMSQDIVRSFTDSCDQLEIRWRRSSYKNVAVTRRGSVALMDSFIGPKR